MVEELKAGVHEHPIQVVANRTGLSADVLRVWERRYGAVSPRRTDSNRRLYSDEDLERLKLIRRAIEGGRSIGLVARLSKEELRNLVFLDEETGALPHLIEERPDTIRDEQVASYMTSFLTAVRTLDRDELEAALTRASLAFARPVFIEQLLIPLLHKMGDLWSTGSLRIVHEHSASAVLRALFGGMINASGLPQSSPALVAATPAGQAHEFGAMAASVMAIYDGWRVIYLGADLPTEEIAAVIDHRSVNALALSIVYPPDDANLIRELRNLRRLIHSNVPVIVGGNAVEAYRRVLEDIGAIVVHSLEEFRNQLRLIRL
ncbi:MAG: MerR family transcriptional regulator [Deltaproteobacteria bacterium]|nr:MerR family transcriptional regulator [Deltaproteobacteria bacterium]